MGSTFKIYLPAAEGQERPAAPITEVRAAGGDETILVAEDEEGVL